MNADRRRLTEAMEGCVGDGSQKSLICVYLRPSAVDFPQAQDALATIIREASAVAGL